MAQSELEYHDGMPQQALNADKEGQPESLPPAHQTEGPGSAIPHWSRRRIVVGFALWGAGVILLVALSFAANKYPELPGDVGLAAWIQQLRQPVLKEIVNFSSDANWPYPAGIIAISMIALLLVFRRVRAALCAAIAGFGADFLNVNLNSWVARPRPNNVQIQVVAHLGLHSFPSGHVTHVIAFYGFLLYLSLVAARDHQARRPWLLIIQVICGYFLVFIGFSRVLEGEHWPSDILAGYLLGGLVLTVAIALYHALGIWWQKRRLNQTDSHPAGSALPAA